MTNPAEPGAGSPGARAERADDAPEVTGDAAPVDLEPTSPDADADADADSDADADGAPGGTKANSEDDARGASHAEEETDSEQNTDEAIAAGGEVEATDARLSDVVDARSVRRAPRFGAFLAVGLLTALLLVVGLSFVRDAFLPAEQVQARSLDTWGVFWVLLIFLAPALALASYGVAVWLDQRSVRRWRARRQPVPVESGTPVIRGGEPAEADGAAAENRPADEDGEVGRA